MIPPEQDSTMHKAAGRHNFPTQPAFEPVHPVRR